jgi:hypothetical protein
MGLAYPDWAAAGLLSAGSLLSRGKHGFARACVFALLLAALKLRFAPLGAGLVVAAALEKTRKGRTVLLLEAVALLAAILAVDHLLLGGRFFWARYGNFDSLRVIYYRTLGTIPTIVSAPFWMLFDSEAGLIWRAPWLLLAPAGYAALRRRAPFLCRSLLLATSLYLATMIVWLPDSWHSMPTPSGRLFVPILPMLAACAAFSGRGGRLLVALSVLPAALAYSMPLLRFNSLDGTDRLFQYLDPSLAGAFPSMVRPDALVAAAWACAAIAFTLLVYRDRQKGAACLAAICLVGAGSLAHRLGRFAWEAEDLPPDYRIGCSLYPTGSDPVERMGWLGSPERLLRLSSREDAVILPIPEDRESIEVEITLRAFSSGPPMGLEILCGPADTSVTVPSLMAPVPGWLESVRGEGIAMPPEPGTAAETRIGLRIPAGGQRMVALRCVPPVPAGPLDGIYLDRIEIR